jgi:c-di-GMP-binding flagellar brake protein YcgR
VNLRRDRRRFERFSLALPAEIHVATPEGERTFYLRSQDISAGGAFFDTSEIIPPETQLSISFFIRSDKLKTQTGLQALVEVTGKVVRSTMTGVAICFDEDYHMLKSKA